MPRCSIVIPNYNGRHHLAECFDSLAAQTFEHDFEVVLVDNGSSDGSVEFAASDYPWVTAIDLGRNTGFPSAVNAGIRHGTSEFVALLNNDTVADPNWLRILIAALDETPSASFAACKMLRYADPATIDAAADGYSMRLGAGVSIGQGDPATDYSRRAWVFGACAGAAIYRRSMFDDIGLFDEEFFLVFEDIDIDMRAQVAGHKCLYVPDAVVLHKRGASTDNESLDVQLRAFRNRLWVVVKSLPAPLLIAWLLWFVPRTLFVIAVRAFQRWQLGRGGDRVAGLREAARSGFVRTSMWTAIRQGATGAWPRRAEVRAKARVGSLQLFRVLNCRHRPL